MNIKKYSWIVLFLGIFLSGCAQSDTLGGANSSGHFSPPRIYNEEFIVYRQSFGNDLYQYVEYGDQGYNDGQFPFCSAHIGRCMTVVYEKATGKEVYKEISGNMVNTYNYSEPNDIVDGKLIAITNYEGGSRTVVEIDILTGQKKELYTFFDDTDFTPSVPQFWIGEKHYYLEKKEEELRVYEVLNNAVSRTVDDTPSFLIYEDPAFGEMLEEPMLYRLNTNNLRLVDTLMLQEELSINGYGHKGFSIYTGSALEKEYIFDPESEKMILQ